MHVSRCSGELSMRCRCVQSQRSQRQHYHPLLVHSHSTCTSHVHILVPILVHMVSTLSHPPLHPCPYPCPPSRCPLRYPQKYVPAFGGYCTYAASLNVLKDITPSCFDILDGRLVLFHNESALEIWHEDAERTFAKSKANWAGLVVQHGTHAGSRVLVNQEDGPVAIQGYDPVAYIEQKEAVQGNAQFSSVFGGMIYRFASPANQATFQESPAKYMPSYGGYCGYGVSLNVLKDITPTCFDVVDGRLVLVHNQKALELWKHSPSRTLHRADANWPGFVGLWMFVWMVVWRCWPFYLALWVSVGVVPVSVGPCVFHVEVGVGVPEARGQALA